MKALFSICAVSLLLAGCGTIEGFGRGVRDVGVAVVSPAPVYVAPAPVVVNRGWGWGRGYRGVAVHRHRGYHRGRW